MNRDELYAEAKRLDIPGRSAMSKAELEAAIDKANETTEVATFPYCVEHNTNTCDHNLDAVKMLSYEDRVTNYAKQNNQAVAVLTPRQRRRAAKKANRLWSGQWLAVKSPRHG